MSTVSKVANAIDWNGILVNVGNHLNDWINTLAHSLGVAADFLMTMEIKQMYIYGFRYALIGALLTTIWIFLVIAFFKVIKSKDSDEAFFGGSFILFTIVALGLGDIWILTEAVGHFVNPAHYALNDIINQINTLRNGGQN